LEFFAVAVKNVQPRARLTSKGGAGYGNYFANVRFAQGGYFSAIFIVDEVPRVI
jgi:hypothetical protein